MKVINGTFFEAKVALEKMNENGSTKSVKEVYAVKCDTFTECEAMVTEEISQYSQGDFAVVGESIAPYKEVLMDDSGLSDGFSR